MSKKAKIKKLVVEQMRGVFTVKQIYFWVTGSRAGGKWMKPLVECSVSTVRQALNELVDSGEVESFYLYGHCYDECRYRVIGK